MSSDSEIFGENEDDNYRMFLKINSNIHPIVSTQKNGKFVISRNKICNYQLENNKNVLCIKFKLKPLYRILWQRYIADI